MNSIVLFSNGPVSFWIGCFSAVKIVSNAVIHADRPTLEITSIRNQLYQLSGPYGMVLRRISQGKMTLMHFYDADILLNGH